jgi:putative membrane protein
MKRNVKISPSAGHGKKREGTCMIKDYFIAALKGMGMGAANVIPGVSGGTIALITGIFQRLIDALKSFDLQAFKLFFTGRWRAFARHTNFFFLLAVFAGAAVSILSLARLFRFLFDHYPVFIWSYFFGLILASVFFVGKTIGRRTPSVVLVFILGAATAAAISFLRPAAQNDSFWYLVICGIVAICSMILPGISGSFVLILMGNYELIVIDAVNALDLRILLPVALGAVVGLVAFSHFLSWIFRKFRAETISTLTGFILGSLLILWPWKTAVWRLDADGAAVVRNGKKLVEGYAYNLPPVDEEFWRALAMMAAGILTIWVTEKLAARNDSPQ